MRRGEYLCEHCGSRYYVNGEDGAESEEEAEARLAALFVGAWEYEAWAFGEAPDKFCW